jgi:PAS domain S-box-containing protein
MPFDWSAFAEECPAPIVVLRDDGSIVFANRATAKLLGHGLAAVEERGLGALVPQRLHPPSGRGWIAHAVDLTTRARPAFLPLLHAGGAEIEAEWTALSGHDETGRETLALVFSQKPPALSPDVPHVDPQMAQVHRAIFENAPVAIFYLDARGVITACNDRFVEMIGSTRRHLIGLSTRTLPNRDMVATIERALAGQRSSYEGDYTSVTGNKTTSVRVAIEPILAPDGAVLAVVGQVEDISEQRKAREIAARAERLASLGTLAAGVAHEAQNPLAFVGASLDLALRSLEEGAADPANLRRLITDAREGVTRVGAIVRDLKTFAMSDEQKRGPVAVDDAIRAAYKLVESQIASRARFVADFAKVPPVWAAEARLVQVFVNLLVNAAEATPAGSPGDFEIRVKVRATSLPAGRVRVEVEDMGRGVAAADAARVFEPFWTDKPQGMGLGLSICHGIVTALGGEIFVDTDRPAGARGTRVVVLLPIADGARAQSSSRTPAVTGPAPAAVAAPARRARVLIVDDEERLALTLKLALSAAHDVEVATRGRRAIELLRRAPYHVVLCDLMLPDVSGIDVYEQAVAARPELAPRFVFLTGGAFQDRAREFLQSVDNARLEKPFDLDVLERLVGERAAAAAAGGA